MKHNEEKLQESLAILHELIEHERAHINRCDRLLAIGWLRFAHGWIREWREDAERKIATYKSVDASVRLARTLL
jgi:hypothetical protein